MRKNLPIGTYQYRSKQPSARKLVNCTSEQATPDSGKQIIVRRMPGIGNFETAGTKIRGAHFFKGEMFVVSDISLFKVTKAGIVSTIGTVVGMNRVSISDNGTDMVIVTNPHAFRSDGVTVSQITDSVFLSFGGVSDVDFLDGFFVFTVPDSRVTFSSGLNSLTFNALDFASVEGSTDNLLGLIVDHREIIYLKERTVEIFYNAAIATGFPMARSNPGGLIEIGGASKDTLAKLAGSVYWLANDNTVRQLNGTTPSIVSNIGISKFIADQDSTKAFGFAYTIEDKHYYVLTFPGLTLEYDILAREWHNRETFTKSKWDVVDVLRGYDDIFAFSDETGDIGNLSNDIRTEFGGVQKVSWTYQEVASDGKRILHDRFELQIATGVGLTSGQGSDPMVELFISDDGGQQFYSFDTRSLGKIGDYKDRVFWHGLGSAYNRVYRCEISDAVDVIAFDTSVEIRGGRF